MRVPLLGKILFIATNVTVLFFVFHSLRFQTISYTKQKFNDAVNVLTQRLNFSKTFSDLYMKQKTKDGNGNAFKYILQWTSPNNVPFNSMGVGQEAFISRNCAYTNCIVTSDKEYLEDITKFDVVIFAGPEVVYFPDMYLPQNRSQHQKYVFASIESSGYYPVCSNRFDCFFNWTWTFRLESDVRWGYMIVRDVNNKVIGPNKTMHWLDLKDMDPVSEKFKQKLKSKTKAVAWFVSNCFDRNGRLEFALELQAELLKYNLMLDIYGECGKFSCPREENERCMKMLEEKYFFYLSFENSFSEDYATEKLLLALQNNVVPIVYGGANYTRFMPKGIYLDALELGVKDLAAEMADIIKDPEKYANFFKWKNYYSYHSKHESPDTNEYCQMCEILNDEDKVKRPTIIRNFRDWWDNPKEC